MLLRSGRPSQANQDRPRCLLAELDGQRVSAADDAGSMARRDAGSRRQGKISRRKKIDEHWSRD